MGHENDLEDIISHPWLQEYNKEDFENETYTPSYIPTISANILDDTNFDPDFNKAEIDFSEVS